MGSRGRRAVLAAVLAAFAAVVVAQDAPPVRWEKDVADALARARAESRPVLFAFNKDEEAANDETALRLYRDPRFAAKSGEFVCVPCSVYDHVAAGPCPRFPGVTCAEHKACELEARRRYLGGATTVVAPQHVFVGPDGVELFRKEYFASLDELLALMDDAVIRVHPEKAESRRAATRPVGATPTPTPPPDAPPTSLDVLVRTLQELRAAKGDAVQPAADRVAELKGPDVDGALEQLLARGGALRLAMLRAIGRAGPPSRATLVLPWIDDAAPAVRRHAAVALEELGAKEHAPLLAARLATEDDGATLGDLLRATAALNRDLPELRDAALRALRHRDEGCVRQAAIVLGRIPADDEVRRTLVELLEKGRSERVKACAAWSLANLHEKTARLTIERLRKRATGDPKTTAALEKACDRLAGKPPADDAWREAGDSLAGATLPRRRKP